MMNPKKTSPLIRLLQEVQKHASAHPLFPQEQQQVIQVLSGLLQESARESARPLPSNDMQKVRGQSHVKRALEVAAAGSHNILLVGPPGAGKRLLAQTLRSILPETIHPLPFHAPFASIDLATFVGCSDPLMLGVLTLAHEGLLFLDHLSAFAPAHLEALQQAVERRIVMPQGTSYALFPAHFLLVATVEPCPCGWYGDPGRTCTCLAEDRQTYRQGLREVIASCFAMQIEVPSLREDVLLDERPGEPSARIRQRVEVAQERQQRRFAGTTLFVNSDLASLSDVQYYCQLEDGAVQLLQMAVRQLHLSVKEVVRIQSVARSIADLDQHDAIAAPHLAEAIQYWGRFEH